MTTVFYRKEYCWTYPQIIFNNHMDEVVWPDDMEDNVARWREMGLTQTVLANGYDESVHEISISKISASSKRSRPKP